MDIGIILTQRKKPLNLIERMTTVGYFTELAQEYIDYDFDRSYPSPEQQLLWRLDDLNDKLAELQRIDAPYRMWTRLSDDDIRYANPEYFDNIEVVEKAIGLAVDDLKNKYEIDIYEEKNSDALITDGTVDEQMTLFEIILLQLFSKPLKAA